MIGSVSQLLYVSFLLFLKAQRVGRYMNAFPGLKDVRCSPKWPIANPKQGWGGGALQMYPWGFVWPR